MKQTPKSLKSALLFYCTPPQTTLSIFQLASAAGFKCDIDPTLVAAITSMQTGSVKKKKKIHRCHFRRTAWPSLSLISLVLQTTRRWIRSTSCPACSWCTSPCPCPPWPWTPTHSTASRTEVQVHSPIRSQLLRNRLTVISPPAATPQSTNDRFYCNGRSAPESSRLV